MKKHVVKAGLLLALLVGTSTLWAADTKADLDKSVAALDKAGQKPEGQARVLEGISKDTGVPVQTLAEQRDKTKLGYGGLFIANALAKETGKTFDQIAALHKDGKGWGQIAKEHNVKLGPIVSQAKRAEKAAERAKNTDKPVDRKKPGDDKEGGKGDDKVLGKRGSEPGGKPSESGKPPGSPAGGRGGGRGK